MTTNRSIGSIPLGFVLLGVLVAGGFTFERAGISGLPVGFEKSFALAALLVVSAITALSAPRLLIRSPATPYLALTLSAIAILAGTTINPALVHQVDGVRFLDLALLSSVATAALLFGCTARTAPRAAIKALIAVGIVFASAGIAAGGDRVAAFGGGPNAYGRLVDIGLIAVVAMALTTPAGWKRMVAPGLLMAAALILSGSRGALLGTLFGLGVLTVVAITRSGRLHRFRAFGLVVGGSVAVYLLIHLSDRVGSAVESRIVTLTLERADDAGRAPLWAHSRAMFGDRPLLGNGLGSFEATYGGGFSYPHNLILQLLAEGGVATAILIVGGVAVVAAQLFIRNLPMDVVGVIAVGLAIFVAAQFSGDYYDSRYYFASFGLASGWIGAFRASPPSRTALRSRFGEQLEH